ncbi:MAG TPA: response regulator [Elusimicrobiota bacterium]|nr:response regulator [Elusimicrobiota bacterium]
MKAANEGRPRIAVVDDEPDFLLLVESWLKPAYEVSAFDRCDGIVEKLRALRPEAVLLDVHMPEESGFRICRRLRAEPGLADLPVIFLTGSKTQEDFLLHLESGGTRYLTKPIGRSVLLEALSEQFGRRRTG